jgi:hypothetical protein
VNGQYSLQIEHLNDYLRMSYSGNLMSPYMITLAVSATRQVQSLYAITSETGPQLALSSEYAKVRNVSFAMFPRAALIRRLLDNSLFNLVARLSMMPLA